MREILFRGKDIISGEWISGFLVSEKHIGNWVQSNPIIPETVGQFTGLTDKNGKKIFEGDILSSSWGYKGAVEFDAIMYAKLECLFNEDCEVVGNIHDNPELVEVQDGNKKPAT